jgi:hypothetical protein
MKSKTIATTTAILLAVGCATRQDLTSTACCTQGTAPSRAVAPAAPIDPETRKLARAIAEQTLTVCNRCDGSLTGEYFLQSVTSGGIPRKCNECGAHDARNILLPLRFWSAHPDPGTSTGVVAEATKTVCDDCVHVRESADYFVYSVASGRPRKCNECGRPDARNIMAPVHLRDSIARPGEQ